MIKNVDNIQSITCDKCGHTDSFKQSEAGKIFFNLGWQMNGRAKKYVHLCRNCQTGKQRKLHDFAARF